MKEFYITIPGKQFDHRVKVVQETLDKDFETFTLLSGDHRLVLKSNRPLLRRKGLKLKKPDFTILEGELTHEKAFNSITKAILHYMDFGEEPKKPKRVLPSPPRERKPKSPYNKPPRITLGEMAARSKEEDEAPGI